MTQIQFIISDKERLLMQQLYIALLMEQGCPADEAAKVCACFPWEVRR